MSPLFCRIGIHAPRPDGRWNGGYCFTRCRRCGTDMVRSAFGEWHVPRGFRVVWSADGAREHAVVPGTPASSGEAPAASEPPPRSPDPPPPSVARPAPPPPPAPAERQPSPRRDGSPFDFSEFEDAPAAVHELRSAKQTRPQTKPAEQSA